jgi:D-xylose 1-dehydrogenase (NADP+, D-xylono-1,5-lactone-forming)
VIAHRPVRWGILGTGHINVRFLADAAPSRLVEIAAIASRTMGRAVDAARTFGIERAHRSYEALLADPGVDAVYICLPNGLHHEWTMRALEAGKHVLCEKPYSRRPEEVIEAFDAAERAGLILMEAFMWRHSEATRRLVELLPRIGPVHTLHGTFSFRIRSESDIRLDPALQGGCLMDVGAYCVSGARLVAGEEPDRVVGEQHVGASGVDERFTGLLHFPSGVTATFSAGFRSSRMGLEVIGARGTIRMREPWPARSGAIEVDGETETVPVSDPYRLERENMSAAIRGEAPALLGREDALGQARVIEALYRSAATGAMVSL